jgi:hypothetical protein
VHRLLTLQLLLPELKNGWGLKEIDGPIEDATAAAKAALEAALAVVAKAAAALAARQAKKVAVAASRQAKLQAKVAKAAARAAKDVVSSSSDDDDTDAGFDIPEEIIRQRRAHGGGKEYEIVWGDGGTSWQSIDVRNASDAAFAALMHAFKARRIRTFAELVPGLKLRVLFEGEWYDAEVSGRRDKVVDLLYEAQDGLGSEETEEKLKEADFCCDEMRKRL